MSWAPLGNAGEGGGATITDTGDPGEGGNFYRLDVTVTLDVAIGDVVVFRGNSALGALGSGPTNRHKTVTDDRGNVWTKIYEYGRGEFIAEGAGDGQVVSLWRSQLTVGLSIGDTVSLKVEFNARFNVAATLNAFSIGGVGFAITVLDAGGASAQTGPPTKNLTLGATADVVWLGAACHDGANDLTVTLDADFTTDRTKYSPAANTTVLWGQWRSTTSDTESWDNTLSSDRPWVMVLAALSTGVFMPPVEGTATPGPREYQAEFESPLFGVSGTSTTRRPDAVSLDYLTAHTTGPTDVEDVTDGLLVRRWRTQVIPWPDDPVNFQQVLLSRTAAGNATWEAAASLFFIPLPFTVETDLCFDEAGRTAFVCERPTGAGGAPEVWLRWYDDLNGSPPGSDPAYVFSNLGAGRTPRMLLDLFPYVGTHCPPFADIQVVYLKTGGGIKRREQRDRFVTEYSSPVTDDTDLYLEEFFPILATRQLRVAYYRRNRPRGRYGPPLRLDSLPYNNHLLARPNFSPGLTNDIAWYRGELFRNPDDATPTDDFTMRVTVTEAVSGIQLQCADEIPDGEQPVEAGGIWTEQNQDSIGDLPDGIASGGGYAFTVSVEHGLGVMSPKAFRARTYQVISGVTCYSPWRYWNAAIEGLPDLFDVVETLVNCERDSVVCFDNPGLYIYQYDVLVNDPNLGGCADPPTTDASSCAGSGFFAGGWQPFPPLWRRDWGVQVRSTQAYNFSDPDGTYTGTLLGRAFKSWAAGVGGTMPDSDQSPLQIPA